MKRRPVVWVQRPDEEDEVQHPEMTFEVVGDWVAVDRDQLLLDIRLLERDGQEVDGRALLKQYGGEGLLNDMLMSEQDLEEGSTWRLHRWQENLTIEPTD